jgi:hypothetical protein
MACSEDLFSLSKEEFYSESVRERRTRCRLLVEPLLLRAKKKRTPDWWRDVHIDISRFTGADAGMK